MSEKILVPALGESITEATVVKWLKNKGDQVEADEPLVELETDKVNLEVPTPISGVLSEINSKNGDTVEVGAVLGLISQGKTKVEKTEQVKKTKKIESKKRSEEKSNIINLEIDKKLEPKVEEPLVLMDEAPLVLTDEVGKTENNKQPVILSPAVRKIVAEKNINIDQVKADPRQARDVNEKYQSGESVSQNRLSMVYERQITPQFHFEGNLHFTNREFANKLPFKSGGQVKLSRIFWGGRLMLINSGSLLKIPFHLSFGLEMGDQDDKRRRFDNLEGTKGDKTFDQLEKFQNIGAFIQQEWIINKSFRTTFGIRSDINKLKATDRYLNDGDGTGKRTLNNVNPLIGFVYSIRKNINLYGNYSTHFETPTLNELSNNPDPSSSGGFNPGLNPQYAKSVELGLKGFFNENLFIEMAAFKIDALDEIIPFELPDLPGRTFYRNAGTSFRKGFEFGLNSRLSKGLQMSMAYTYSDFSYGTYQTKSGVFDGNSLPAIPKMLLYGELSYFHISGIYGMIQLQYTGDLYADDANTVKDNAYQLMHMRFGYKKYYSNLMIEPFIGLNNLLNTSYNSNIRMNAWGGRYFEPGSEFSIYGGVSIRFE